MIDVMIDLETLSTKPNAAILSIGACTVGGDGERKTFYEKVRYADYEEFWQGEFDISLNTLLWWGEQTKEARDEAFSGEYSLTTALSKFSRWIDSLGEEVFVWGNGAAFDNVVLKHAYDKIGMPAPWSYRRDMCHRTIRRLFPCVEVKQVGVAHNALDDAIYQADYLEASGALSGRSEVSRFVNEFAVLTEQKTNPDMSKKLVVEEYFEWVEASLKESDPESELKELSDLKYVIEGYARARGWDLDEAVRRLHQNNVGRCIQPDGSIKRREDGKILKNPDYPKVDLSDLI